MEEHYFLVNSACLLMQPRWKGMSPPTVIWTLPPQPLIKMSQGLPYCQFYRGYFLDQDSSQIWLDLCQVDKSQPAQILCTQSSAQSIKGCPYVSELGICTEMLRLLISEQRHVFFVEDKKGLALDSGDSSCLWLVLLINFMCPPFF